MAKKELIQIRVTKEQKEQIKRISISKGMTVSEFLLYSAMRTITEEEITKLYCRRNDLVANEEEK